MKINQFILLALTIILTIYFNYSALNGQYGLFNKFKYQAEEIVLLEQLNSIIIKNAVLEKKVSRLSENNLDLDLLDQQARKFLGVARANEIILNFN